MPKNRTVNDPWKPSKILSPNLSNSSWQVVLLPVSLFPGFNLSDLGPQAFLNFFFFLDTIGCQDKRECSFDHGKRAFAYLMMFSPENRLPLFVCTICVCDTRFYTAHLFEKFPGDLISRIQELLSRVAFDMGHIWALLYTGWFNAWPQIHLTQCYLNLLWLWQCSILIFMCTAH